MSTTDNALARAIKYLEAVEVEPGRYAWRDEERGCYRVVGEEMMEALGWGLIDHIAPHETVRMHWENQEMGVDLPEWWKPERQFALRHVKTGEVVDASTALERAYYEDESFDRITIDLNTGKEIEA